MIARDPVLAGGQLKSPGQPRKLRGARVDHLSASESTAVEAPSTAAEATSSTTRHSTVEPTTTAPRRQWAQAAASKARPAAASEGWSTATPQWSRTCTRARSREWWPQ